ncbi:MAG TPA: hypothetical protein VIA18_00345 [Polyangia bacterium]|nr:hypothetical protein [Polyangia bacterium]
MSEPLQFDRAEDDVAAGAAPATTARSCAGCQKPIADRYFTVQGKIMCPACHGRIMAAINERFATGSFGMALLRGGLAALLGAAIFYGVTAMTGWQLGLVAVLVGYLVGKGVAQGAHHKGGFGYQALAVGLTYISVALTAVPEVLQLLDKEQHKGAVHIIGAVFLVMFSPFFMAYASPLSAVINGFALWEAWKLNRTPKLDISGPHIVNAPAAPIVLDAPPPHVG